MKAMSMKAAVALLAALLILALGFEAGARSVKFSPADSVEFSGIILGGKAAKSSWSM